MKKIIFIPSTRGIWFCIFFVISFVGLLLACNPEPGPNHFPPPADPLIPVGFFQVHNTLNGLPCNNIRSILALPNMILVGTEGGGLMIRTGNSWNIYTDNSTPSFPSPTVSCFLKESDNTVLAGTPNGLVRITGITEGALTFTLLPISGPLGPDILSLAKDDLGKGLIAGTFYGAGDLVVQFINPFIVPNGRNPTGFASIRHRGTEAWFGSSDGLMKLEGRSLELRVFPPFEFGWVQALESTNNKLFVGGAKGLFQLFDDACSEILPGVWITALRLTPGVIDPMVPTNGQVLVAESSSRLKDSAGYKETMGKLKDLNARYEQIMDFWTTGRFNETVYNKYLKDLAALEDRAQITSNLLKGLWVGTQESGAILFSQDGKKFHFTKDNSKLPMNRITAISCLDSGETWIGTYDGGLLQYRNLMIKPSAVPIKVWEGKARTIQIINDDLYIGTENDGLLIFNPKSLEQVNQISNVNHAAFHSRVNTIAEGGKDKIWIGGNSGLWLLDSSGWKQFTRKNGLPADDIIKVTADTEGRVYAAGKVQGKSISNHLSGYNGTDFTPYSVDILKSILAMEPSARDSALRAMGFLDTYPQAFDTQDASKALALYDSCGGEDAVVDMLATKHYLLIAGKSGRQYIFNGSAFKPLNIVGKGDIDHVFAYGKRSNSSYVIMGPRAIRTFDGNDFLPVFDLASPSLSKYTGITMDDMNADLFWASMEAGEGGVVGLYQEPRWDVATHPEIIRGLARSTPYVFGFTDTAVYRFDF